MKEADSVLLILVINFCTSMKDFILSLSLQKFSGAVSNISDFKKINWSVTLPIIISPYSSILYKLMHFSPLEAT